MLLLNENYQSQGFGNLAHVKLEDYLRHFSSIFKIRLAVVNINNKVLKYWEKIGFHLRGEVKTYSNKLINTEALIMEKELV